MHLGSITSFSCLLGLSSLVSSAPIVTTEGATRSDILISKDNTLNATTYSNDTVTETASLYSNDTTTQAISIPDTYPVPANGRNLTAQSYLHPDYNGTRANTNGTYNVEAIAAAADGRLQLKFINNWHTQNLMVTISGLDEKGSFIMLGQNGQWVYPTTSSATPVPVKDNIAIPIGKPNSTLPITLPGYISSSRVWISEGPLKFYIVKTPTGTGLVEPAAVNPNDANSQINYAFGELTWTKASGLWADITAVDFVGLPLGIDMMEASGKNHSVFGTPANAATALCEGLKAQKEIDGRPWDQLCTYKPNGELIRVLAPNLIQSQNKAAFGTYFAKYVDDVWNYYKTHDLTINTQAKPGNVTCRVTGSTLNCAGDNRGYPKPNNVDIFGCNTGPFTVQAGDNEVHQAVVPRLCAAFNRASFLIPGGNIQPALGPRHYYAADQKRAVDTRPMNHYSRLVHEMEVDQKGYAFSYDDVSPSYGEDQAGLVTSMTPKMLTFIVGGSG
ncbi:Glucan endo-1,3-beta-glucosidase [Fulvia fulva]|uniref:Glucan endo-1,3-beta-glucosidase n=1 Tax=Passalora fulva TaxID=5499 RepID=A0A9Q8LBW2_PASFU|nr:Glucan endo-1,3-beta-glucosidase [Fulvia fulva]KAK4632082.1 Glucan endo-1,3-beta-glucosidase [Fulvia fulva]KAK4633269.1 Glucan endo-1,3-beta-glucosidase [Fulvia fulva]UJO14515.1 Glucan endo-1,3-beta-glucosidase [Fulvia fulva]WPV10821.1 Glucan endo-1,3-beta-glucosidase [Fulvia fulva]WPV26053.1 Glucan endo-1,3-beta-glucosidase [Fulvia fulva]